jgi:hypothetical protein
MATPEEEQIDAQIHLLLAIQFEGMNPADRQNLMDSMDDIKAEYLQAAEKAKTSKYYKDVSESIAKSLPLLVKGTYSAVTAFQKGDYISGTAALFDIASSVIPVFASLASAGGPPGVLIGALFSVVAQILSFFAPKQPSIESKIQKMLDQLQSETEIEKITAFGHSISSYTRSLRAKCMGEHKWDPPEALAGTVALKPGVDKVLGTGTSFTKTTQAGQWLAFDADTSATPYKIESIDDDMHLTLTKPYKGGELPQSALKLMRRTTTLRSIDEILKMPLTSEMESDKFLVEIKELNWGLMRDQQKLDTPVFANWEVAGYLEREANQSKEGWPEVLGLWCQAYIDMLSANAMLSCLADPKTLDARIAETQESNPHPRLPPKARADCHSAFLKMAALSKGLRAAWESDRKEMLKIVKKVKPAARERGLYAHLGYYAGGNVLYVATGKGKAKPLEWDYKGNTAWLTGISLHVPKSQQDSFTPRYTLLTCEIEKGHTRSSRHIVDSVTGTVSDGMVVIDARGSRFGEKLHDVSGYVLNEGTPGFDASTHPVTLVALALEDGGGARYVNYYSLDSDFKSTRVNTEPYLDGIEDIRSMYFPTTALPDDPDADAITGPARLGPNSVVVYGGVRNKNRLDIMYGIEATQVEGPQNWSNYEGVEVDPNYVWLFGRGGIACATHASILKCRQGKLARPSWIYHDFDKQVFKDPPEVKSLFPCADGTLFVSMPDDLYTADYSIDRQKNRVLTSSWVKRGGSAKQVIKMVIPCWRVLESLKSNLESD